MQVKKQQLEPDMDQLFPSVFPPILSFFGCPFLLPLSLPSFSLLFFYLT